MTRELIDELEQERQQRAAIKQSLARKQKAQMERVEAEQLAFIRGLQPKLRAEMYERRNGRAA